MTDVTLKDYKPMFAAENTWCAGCGDYGILAAIQQALVALEVPPHEVMIFSGIGCGSKLPDYLRSNGFKTFIVSGGGIEFMCPWTEAVYGIPPEQVIGSRIKIKHELRAGRPVLVRMPELDFIDDKQGKPIAIHQIIGRRPIFAAGNSDGDFQMLEWTTTGEGPRFAMIVRHTDAEREWAYDRESHVGRLDRGLDEAPKRGWLVIDMQRDWTTVYPAAR